MLNELPSVAPTIFINAKAELLPIENQQVDIHVLRSIVVVLYTQSVVGWLIFYIYIPAVYTCIKQRCLDADQFRGGNLEC